MYQYTQQNYQALQKVLTPLKNKIYALEQAQKTLEKAWAKYSEIAENLAEVSKLEHTNDLFKELEVKFKVRSGRATVIHGLQKEVVDAWDNVQKAMTEVSGLI